MRLPDRAGRRALLFTPALLLARPARAGLPVPPFPQWIGRTALLRGEGGAARLLLADDGTGLMAVRWMFLCRAVPIRSWEMNARGTAITYRRPSVLDPSRTVAGEARILPEGDEILWVEARRQTAEFDGFAEASAARSCG
jgi:hypothetical protein